MLILPLLFGLSFALHSVVRPSAPALPAAPAEPPRVKAGFLDPAEYAADPAFNPLGLRLSASQEAELGALISECRETARLAAALMHERAADWARTRIDLGQAEWEPHEAAEPASAAAHPADFAPASSRRVRAPEGGARVGVTDAYGIWSVTVYPGEYEPFDLAFAEREELASACRHRILRFFETLASSKPSSEEVDR